MDFTSPPKRSLAIYSINGFGYGLMSLATLFAAPVFRGEKLERWVRWAWNNVAAY
jgi:hypothetical protein